MASGKAQCLYLTDQLANSKQLSGSSLPKQSVTTSIPFSLPALAAGWSCLYVHFFLRLACSCLSVFQPKELPEVGEEDSEPVRSMLKAAPLGFFWFVSVAGLEDFPQFLHLSWQMCPGSLETRETISVWGKNSQTPLRQ